MGIFKRRKVLPINLTAVLEGVQHQLLVSVIALCLVEGISIGFWATKDRTAICVNLWHDGEKENLYVKDSKELENVLHQIMDEISSPNMHM